MGEIKRIRELGFHWEILDPFMFCAFHQDNFPKGESNFGPAKDLLKDRFLGNDFQKKDGWRMYHGKNIPGFPYHPHAGFETITLVEKGFAEHSDSLGAKGRFGEGDVQWMTAGKGVLHSEMFPLLNQDRENPLLLFQIWLNLPRKSKKVDPHYKMLWSDKIPSVFAEDSNGLKTKVKIIAGEFNNTKAIPPTPDSWAAEENNQLNIWRISMPANAEFELPKASPEVNRILFFYEGDTIQADGFEIPVQHSIELNSNESLVLKNGNKDAEFMMLQGKPINEPVVQQGPFVANTRPEIQEIISEFQKTQFGGWPWPEAEQVHTEDEGRFAKHDDGSVEKP
ncbi:MAG: pirin family protein [Psychroflexus sp.]